MALSDLEKARSDDALGRVLAAGISDLLAHSVVAQVELRGDEPTEALAAIERDLRQALEKHEVDPLVAIAYRAGLRSDLKQKIGVLLRGAITEAAERLQVKPPPRIGSH